MLGYADFGRWYDRYRADVLEPSLEIALGALHDVLDEELSERDLARIRNVSGRVKSKRRTWRKLGQVRYNGRVEVADDIPHVIDDLIGLRVTCTNLRDIEMVQAALDDVPRRPVRRQTMWLDTASERDYVLEPKDSGYRGWHVNVGIAVPADSPGPDGTRPPVTAELQVRTLLQDSWGELTHVDSYSKDGALPPLVEVLSKRMADLFATLDDIAEDLRTELDRIDEAVVADSTADGADSPEGEIEGGQARDAADVLLDRWHRLHRPVDLASLAWTLQHEFGAEVSDDWFGHTTFKRFLRHAVPDGEISTGRQAYLLPPSTAADSNRERIPPTEPRDAAASAPERDAAAGTDGVGVPDEGIELRRIDPAFPAVTADRWQQMYVELADAWRRLGQRPPTPRFASQLSRSARDHAEAGGTSLSRRHLGYVARTVVAAQRSGDPLGADDIADAFTSLTVAKMIDLRIVDTDDRSSAARIERWLAGG